MNDLSRDGRRISGAVRVLALGLSLGAATAAWAVDLEAEFRAGYGRSNNIARSADNRVDDRIETAGITLDADENTRKFDFYLRSDFDYLKYQDGTFDSEVVGGLDAAATYWFVEDRFNWVVQDNFGQELFDPFATTSPGNREDVNFLTTGPSLRLAMGARNYFGLDLRASKVNYETRPYDNDRTSVRAFISREISPDAELSVNLRTQSIEFESMSPGADYDIDEAFLRYELMSSRNRITLDAGYATVDRDTSADKQSGVTLAAEWRRELSTRSTVTYFAGSGYSDGASLFRNLQGSTNDVGQTADVQGIEAPFRNNYAGVRFDLRSERTQGAIDLSWYQDDYLSGINLDRDYGEVDLRLNRSLTRDLFFEARFRYQTREYKYIDRSDDDVLGSLALGYNFTPSFSSSVEVQYFDRSSNDDQNSFNETRYFLRFAYVPAWGRPKGR